MQREGLYVGSTRLSFVKSGNRRPVLFQHGLCGSASQTAAVFPKDVPWSCLTMECRGHGESECGEFGSLSLAQFTNDLADFIDDQNIGPVIAGGISMGAALALRLAVKHPEKVSGLILARPAWVTQEAPENLAPNREVAQLLDSYEPKAAKLRFENSATAAKLKRDSPDNLTSLMGFFDRTPLAETQALLAAIATDGPSIDKSEIANIQAQTLVIGTREDVIHPWSMAQELAALISDSRLVEITSKSSNPQQYQAEFQSALRRFLEEYE